MTIFDNILQLDLIDHAAGRVLQGIAVSPIRNFLNRSNELFIDSIQKKLRRHNTTKVLVAGEFSDPTVLDKGQISNTKVLGKKIHTSHFKDI